MSIDKITNHVDIAKGKLLQQYKDKEDITGLQAAYIEQLQILENKLHDFYDRLDIDKSEGVQLNGIGEIIGLDRNGMTDSEYRVRLKSKILENLSSGTAETIIQIFNLLTGSTVTDFRDIYPAAYQIYGNIAIDTSQVQLIWELLEAASIGGVRVEAIGRYDPDNSFAMDGDLLYTGGFGDTVDPVSGGKLAELYKAGPDFELGSEGENNAHGGFGDLDDSATGGYFSSL